MKKISICIMLLILAATSFCQQTKSLQQLTREEYLTKSKNQKATGWVAFGVGTVVLAITAISSASNVCIGTGCTKHTPFPIAAVLGTAMMVSSAPLFIASGKNKRKANLMLKDETVFFNPQLNIKKHFVALGVKINL